MARKRKVAKLLQPVAMKIGKLSVPSIDLGALQSELQDATKALKSASTKLANANDAFDAAKVRQQNATARLQAGSRAVIAGE